MRVVHGVELDYRGSPWYNIFGMQNQDSCWCGLEIPDDSLNIDDSLCNANRLGEDLTMAVYIASWEPLIRNSSF